MDLAIALGKSVEEIFQISEYELDLWARYFEYKNRKQGQAKR